MTDALTIIRQGQPNFACYNGRKSGERIYYDNNETNLNIRLE